MYVITYNFEELGVGLFLAKKSEEDNSNIILNHKPIKMIEEKEDIPQDKKDSSFNSEMVDFDCSIDLKNFVIAYSLMKDY